jgi:arabinofuranosyltransferase
LWTTARRSCQNRCKVYRLRSFRRACHRLLTKRRSTTRSVKLRQLLIVLLAALYAVWAASFIARSAIETSAGRYFCLFDDAMVSLRYAWNLAHGGGLVWNPVEGITSFLWTVYMTLGALIFDKARAALFVQITGIPLVLGVALMARWLGRSVNATRDLGLITVGAVLAYYPLSYWSLMGMETGLLTVLALTALLLAMRLGADPEGSRVLGLLLGLMFATRPDAGVLALVILTFRAAWILSEQRRWAALQRWFAEAVVVACVIGGLTLFRWVYYGSPVPNTYQLKLAGWPLAWRLGNGGKFVLPFLHASRYLIGFALCSLVFHRDGRRLLLACFAGSVIACQVWVGGDAWPYWRMLVPGVVVLIVLAVDGASCLVRWLVRTERRALIQGCSLACLAGALWAADQPFLAELQLQTPAYMVNFNRATVQAGIELSQFAEPQGSVAVAAAGAVPYYSGLRGVDVLGKSDRYIARLPGDGFDGQTVTPGHNKYDLHYSIEKLRPDAIYDAVSLSRRPGNDVFEFVRQNYVQGGSFWLRRDSPHIHWDRIPSR